MRLSARGPYPFIIVVAGAAIALLAFLVPPLTLLAVAIVAALGLASLRVREIPVVAYWVLISFVSLTTLDSQFRVQVGQFPIGLTEFGVALLLLGCFVHTAARPRSGGLKPFDIGLAAFLAYSVFATVVGVVHNYPLYALLIDLRAIAYLYVGYWAGLVLLPIESRPRLFTLLGLLATFGFAAQQALVSVRSFPAGITQAIINQRDIGVPFFTGRYGILSSAGILQSEGLARAWWALPSLIVGLVAMALSFVRTGWIATIAGLVALVAIGGRISRMARYALIVGTVLVAAALFVPEVGALGGAVTSRVTDIFSPSSPATDTVASRLNESQQALGEFKSPIDWLVGVGLGLGVDDPLRGNQHNSFVWVLSKEGIIGLALFLVTFAIAPIVMATKSIRNLTLRQRTLAVVLLSAHISNLASGYASGHLTLWPYAPIVGMTIAWLVSLSKLPTTNSD